MLVGNTVSLSENRIHVGKISNYFRKKYPELVPKRDRLIVGNTDFLAKMPFCCPKDRIIGGNAEFL